MSCSNTWKWHWPLNALPDCMVWCRHWNLEKSAKLVTTLRIHSGVTHARFHADLPEKISPIFHRIRQFLSTADTRTAYMYMSETPCISLDNVQIPRTTAASTATSLCYSCEIRGCIVVISVCEIFTLCSVPTRKPLQRPKTSKNVHDIRLTVFSRSLSYQRVFLDWMSPRSRVCTQQRTYEQLRFHPTVYRNTTWWTGLDRSLLQSIRSVEKRQRPRTVFRTDWLSITLANTTLTLSPPIPLGLNTLPHWSNLSLIHIWRCRRIERCRSRWSPYH